MNAEGAWLGCRRLIGAGKSNKYVRAARPAIVRNAPGGIRRNIASAGTVNSALRNGLEALPPVRIIRYPIAHKLSTYTSSIAVDVLIVLMPKPWKSGLQTA